jgi:hypothetical protein
MYAQRAANPLVPRGRFNSRIKRDARRIEIARRVNNGFRGQRKGRYFIRSVYLTGAAFGSPVQAF